MAMSHTWAVAPAPTPQKARPFPEQQPWKPPPVEYFACLNGVEITAVDVVSQQFSARGFITLVWVDKELPVKAEKQGSPIPSDDGQYKGNYCLPDDGWMMPLNPNAVFANAIEYELVSCGLAYDGKSGCASQSLKFSAVFSQSMWLSRFPFDRMHCELVLKNQRKTFVLCTEEPEWMKNTACQIWDHQRVNLSLALAPQVYAEFDLDSLGWEIFNKEQQVLSKPKLFARIQRKAHYYLWAIILPCFFFGLITCTSFLGSVPDLSDRLALNTTMMLTIVALKLMTSDSLPKVSYMTLLDYYYAATTLFMVAVIAVNAISAESFIEDDAERKKEVDMKLMTGFMSFWVTCHVLCLIGLRCGWWTRSWAKVAASQQKDDSSTNLKVSRVVKL